MSEKHPLLVFVAGPQKGQHVVLSMPAAVLGRGGDADIMLSEEFVSRRHIRYELLNVPAKIAKPEGLRDPHFGFRCCKSLTPRPSAD